jgi:hypothetical protein
MRQERKLRYAGICGNRIRCTGYGEDRRSLRRGRTELLGVSYDMFYKELTLKPYLALLGTPTEQSWGRPLLL